MPISLLPAVGSRQESEQRASKPEPAKEEKREKQYKRIHQTALRQILEGKSDGALKALEELAARDPEDSETLFMLALGHSVRSNAGAAAAPHYPLHAPPEDIARYRGTYLRGWDQLRRERHRRQIDLGLVDAKHALPPRDPEAQSWEEAPHKDWQDLRMADLGR